MIRRFRENFDRTTPLSEKEINDRFASKIEKIVERLEEITLDTELLLKYRSYRELGTGERIVELDELTIKCKEALEAWIGEMENLSFLNSEPEKGITSEAGRVNYLKFLKKRYSGKVDRLLGKIGEIKKEIMGEVNS